MTRGIREKKKLFRFLLFGSFPSLLIWKGEGKRPFWQWRGISFFLFQFTIQFIVLAREISYDIKI